MTEQTAISHNRKVASKVFFGVFLLLLATAPAISWWGDSKETCLGAHSWVNYGKPITIDADGQPAPSIRPLLSTLMCLPTAVLLPLPDPLESPYIRLGRAVIVPFCYLYLILDQRQWRERLQSLAWLTIGILPWPLIWA